MTIEKKAQSAIRQIEDHRGMCFGDPQQAAYIGIVREILRQHEAEVIERCAKECERVTVKSINKTCAIVGRDVASHIRALSQQKG